MKKIIKILAIVFAVILLDQITKDLLLYLITGNVPLFAPAWTIVPMPYLMYHVCDIFNIVFTWNPGTSFSLFRSLGESAPIIIILATSFVTGFILYRLFTRAEKYEQIPLALIAGGAIGNLIDRIRFGAVIDFLDFHIAEYRWPAFNIADICICIGIGLYLLNWFIVYRRNIKNTKDGK